MGLLVGKNERDNNIKGRQVQKQMTAVPAYHGGL
jgi:hypothetical protein